MSLKIVHSVASHLPGYPHATWFLFDNSRIADSGTDQGWKNYSAAQVIDGLGLTIVEAWTDIHVHGGAGISFENTEHCAQALAIHRAHGTGRMVASLVTNPIESTEKVLSRLARQCERYSKPTCELAALVGIHLEGPFLSPLHKGAHNADFLQLPSLEKAQRLFEASGGYLKQVTIAPELDPNLAVTKFFLARGVKVAVGHTDADYATAAAAFDAGASILTHTFNAMNPLHHRAPGPVAAALDADHVVLELICDGIHVHEPMVRMLYSSASKRIALITDAMAATGCADGHYRLGTMGVQVKNSVARLETNGAIAGSTLTLGAAVHHAYSMGISASAVIDSATSIPSRALNLSGDAGYLLLTKDCTVHSILA